MLLLGWFVPDLVGNPSETDMFSRGGAHSVVLIEIVVGLPIFSFEVLIKSNLLQVNIKGGGPS